MKYYKNINNQIFAYESDGSQDNYIASNLTLITEEEAKTILNPLTHVSLPDLKELKKSEIRAKFEIDSNKSVLALTYSWNGGFDSAIKLDAAKRLSESAGLTSVVFFDLNNIPHSLSFTEALQVIISVASSFQYQLGKKNSLLNIIDAATSVSEVNNVSW